MDLIVENFGQPYKLPFRVLSWVLVIALSTFIYLIHFLFLTYNNTTSAYPFLVVFINYFGIDKLVIFIVKKLERRTNKTQ